MDEARVRNEIEEQISQSLTVPGADDVKGEEMFSERFMDEHTEFEDFSEFIQEYASSIDEDVTGPQIDDFIQSHSQFGSWNNMLQQAEINWMEDNWA